MNQKKIRNQIRKYIFCNFPKTILVIMTIDLILKIKLLTSIKV